MEEPYAKIILEEYRKRDNCMPHWIPTKLALLAMEDYADIKMGAVSGALPLAEHLLRSIKAADPTLSDTVIKDLHSQCKALVDFISMNSKHKK